MQELQLLEKMLGGTVSAVLILGYGCVKLWNRLGAMDTRHNELMREVLLGLSASTEAMRRTAEAVDALRAALDRQQRSADATAARERLKADHH
jgi:hypothetical protein